METKGQLSKPVFITTKQLEPGIRVNMHLKVHSVEVTRERMTYDGEMQRYANVVVGDEHGCCNLYAKNEQLDVIKKGAVITVRNCHANVFQEHLRLEVDKWGKVEASSQNIPSVNLSVNHSDVEYELVPVNKNGSGSRRRNYA
eukprot:CAMPEP_0202955546 /NCGR_PEP_ID=MMETSP1396-20130829/93_1 /ASSEMBLY_ACC=CAM_ASM_000872 /TAXON_ID= /ORGANISM="Pseudokeronopsis sp., Strain Brazil" /LENGTH=142 /DNA_ID=CAMNT_0049672181 /DNA_START=15 /DNA_END=443 /DNA_ORIENTATION=-